MDIQLVFYFEFMAELVKNEETKTVLVPERKRESAENKIGEFPCNRSSRLKQKEWKIMEFPQEDFAQVGMR